MKIREANRLRGAATVAGAPETATGPAAAAGVQAVGDVTSILGIPEPELTENVRKAIMKLMQDVDRLRQELEQSRARINFLENLADQDTLLPVANRRAFVRELTRMMAFSERYGGPSSVLYFDIDSMKEVNDTFGHGAGDAALAHVAEVLLNNIRSSDVVGRLGGDEFGVILAQADEATANEKAALLADAIETVPFAWHDKQIKLTVAVGAYTFQGGDNPGEALDAADRAMYRRKQARNGKDR